MIDIKDLQVGSYIQGGLNTYKIIGISETTVDTEWRKDNEILVWRDCEVDRYEPVPISVQWLRKLGVTMKTGPGIYCHPDPTQNWAVHIDGTTCQFWDREWHKQIEYIHELQALIWNMYDFELTVIDP